MDDRSLREYALNIYKGIRGYTLSKALSLFPKYYPKIVFYYTKILTKQQNEFSLRMIQGLGIDKGRALLNELSILNIRMSKFYVNAKFKLSESYRRIEAATDEDKSNVAKKEIQSEVSVMIQSYDILNESLSLFKKIKSMAKIYNFKSLENDINKVMEINLEANDELYRLNHKFIEYIKTINIKEL